VHIHDYIKFQVDTAGSNFSKWRQILTLLITMYKVVDHITEGVAPSAPSDDWQAVDIHLSLWFMATLTDDLYRLVQGADGRACSTWTRLHRFFLNNGTKRYAFLSKAFRTTSRGDMPVSVYASKLQGIADDLAAIGRPVSDVDLTTQFIDGIGKKFKLEAAILKGPGALPSFANACSHFQLAEIDADAEQADAGAHAYAVHGAGRGAPTGSGVHTSGGHTNQPRMPGVSPNYRGKNPIPGYRPATQQPQHYGDGGRGRGRNNGGQRWRPKCQVCGKFGHIALKCRERFNHAYQADEIHGGYYTGNNFHVGYYSGNNGYHAGHGGHGIRWLHQTCYKTDANTVVSQSESCIL
jgi:hypothetical protein